MQVQSKQTITIDLKKNTIIQLPQFIQNDTNVMEFDVKDNGSDADLSNITRIVMNYKRPDKVVVSRLLTASGNIVTYEIGTEEMQTAGYGEVEIQFFEDDKRISTKRFKVYMIESIGTDSIYEGTDLTLLQDLFVEVADVKTSAETATTNANNAAASANQAADSAKTNWLAPVNTFATIATTYSSSTLGDTVQCLDNGYVYRFNGTEWIYTQGYSATAIADVNEQLAERALQSDFDKLLYLCTASLYGVDESIGTNDATTLLNNYFAALKAKGLRYAYFDKPVTYHVTGLLTEARDLILLGNAKIESMDVKENQYIVIGDINSHFGEKINSYADKAKFTQFRKAILDNSRPINVTVMGDSWGNFGSDRLNVNYKTMTGTQTSPNGVVDSETYPNRLMDMMMNKFKDSNFNFYNRAIGGERLMSWNNQVTFNSVTKAWIDHIKDTAPDLLIIEFGMNSYTFAESVKTAYTIKAVTDYIKANFTIQPDLVFFTVPRPLLNLADTGWGSFERQTSREIGANATRYYGKNVGGYIVDVGRISDIKRIGLDFVRPYFNEVFFTTDENVLEDACDGSIGSGVFTLSNYSQYLRLKNLKDFVIKFDMTFNNVVQSDAIFIEYNKQNVTQTNLLSIYPLSSSNVGKINNSNWWPDFSEWGGTTTGTYSHTTAFSTHNFIIRKQGNVFEIVLDGNIILRDNIYVNDSIGDIVFRLGANGQSTTASISNLRLYKGMYKKYTPIITEQEVWGQYIQDNIATKSKTGGNGVNHVSMLGLESIVQPCLLEFMDDLTAAVNTPLDMIQLNALYGKLSFTAALIDTSYVYYNIPYHIPYKFGRLTNDGGGTFTLNKNVGLYTQRTSLASNEFAVFYDTTNTQILIKSTTTTGWNFESFLKA